MPSPSCKLTPEIATALLEALRAGNFRQTAARAAGITKRTLSRWLAKGEERPRSRYGRFRIEVLRAEQDAEANALRVVITAGPADWRAAAWFLERKYPQRWARRDPQRLELTGKDGGPLELLHGLTDEERVSRIAAIFGVQFGAGGDGALPQPAAAQATLPVAGREAEVVAVARAADGGAEQPG